jgi:phage/conjugal plasmid C-4 type zinc finger TraR family protein
MTGYIGNSADAAQQIVDDYVGNGVYAARYAMQHSYGVVSCTHCKDCGEEIPEARRRVVPGVKFCIECQDDHMVVRKVKMLTKML